MKHDDYFDCGDALERLVARCPGLREDPDVAVVLAQKSSGIDEGGVLEVVQDLVIQPDVGLAVLGCFRPILPRVLDNLVYSLRQLWGQGRGSPGREGEGFVRISRRLRNGGGWDLGLHEHTCILFCRLLDLAPYLLRYVEKPDSPHRNTTIRKKREKNKETKRGQNNERRSRGRYCYYQRVGLTTFCW